LKPKFPFFIDWDTIFDIQGNPEIKALYYTEWQREGGHPDFVYWRTKFESLDLEEKTRNGLIRQGVERMPQQFEGKSPSKEKVEILLNEVDQEKIFLGVVSTLLGLALFVFGFMNLTYGILDPAWSPFMIFIGVLILILGFWTMHKGNEYQTIRI
jgi:hypothetical protein